MWNISNANWCTSGESEAWIALEMQRIMFAYYSGILVNMELRVSDDYVGTTRLVSIFSLCLSRTPFGIVNLHRNCKIKTGRANKN